jgi:hypothetical protein
VDLNAGIATAGQKTLPEVVCEIRARRLFDVDGRTFQHRIFQSSDLQQPAVFHHDEAGLDHQISLARIPRQDAPDAQRSDIHVRVKNPPLIGWHFAMRTRCTESCF